MSVSVIYRDVDFQAKKDIESVQVDGNIKADYTDITLLKFVANPPTRKATLEKDFWRLDGSYDIIDVTEKNCAVFSDCISSSIETENGFELSSAINVQYVFEQVRTISNLTFSFDAPDYCTHLIVEGYADKELTENVFQKAYYPNESFYNCNLEKDFSVAALKFVFLAMNKPNRFFKLYGIDFGTSYTFQENDVYSASILKQISLISQQLYIGTSDIGLKTTLDVFKKYKPVFIYNNNKIDQTHFISGVDRSSYNRVELECGDVMFLLNDMGYTAGSSNLHYKVEHQGSSTSLYLRSKFDPFEDGTNNMPEYTGPYNVDATMDEVLNETQKTVLFKVYANKNNSPIHISGQYKQSNKKDVLNQILFANQHFAIITPTGQVEVRDTLPPTTKNVPATRIFSNYKKNTTEKITTVELKVYKYVKTEKTYTTEKGGETVEESFPMWIRSVSCRPAAAGGYLTVNIISDKQVKVRTFSYDINPDSSTPTQDPVAKLNYFVINEYTITKKVYLENIDANTIQNVATISDIAFITEENEQLLLNSLKDYYAHNSTLEFDMIVEDEDLGDYISVEADGTTYIGRIEKMEYTMQGKKIANVTMRVYEEV